MRINFDEGFQFGWGAFETIAIKNGTALFLDEHLVRLKLALDFLGITNFPIKHDIQSYIMSNNLREHALKIIVSKDNIVFSHRNIPYKPYDVNIGFDLSYGALIHDANSPFARHKTLSRGEYQYEFLAAKQKGAQDHILLNNRGEICETTTANIFFVTDNMIMTPPDSSGLLKGIIRDLILHDSAFEQFSTSEQIITPGDIIQYNECFITNSLMGVRPVRAIGETRFNLGCQSLTARVARIYEAATIQASGQSRDFSRDKIVLKQ
ncbi:MAG: aminotransferase class IV [Desulfobulbaceae bacterium]|jgi:4-amino-4-deoxychorismate lyase|nr:aminotransferase class IV [Desulfobulbaceae bacterium]